MFYRKKRIEPDINEIFSDDFNENYILDPSLVVLEVKYNGFLLGYMKEFLNLLNKQEISVGKYSLSRIVSLYF